MRAPSLTANLDFLVLGSGIAGLTFARLVAPHGKTLLLTKKERAESNSNYAQGGIAGVMSDEDDVSLHIEDTLTAGAGLCHEDAVRVLVTEGPERIEELIRLGARFSREVMADGREVLSLGREGGHSRNRIVHAVDRTGWEIERTLLSAVKDLPSLDVREHFFVLDLAVDSAGRCVGAYALDTRASEVSLFRARAVLLATGGCGQVYLHTTNPAIATGDGVAMARRAGAPIANMEFIQFHPTALYHPEGKSFLISEAVRGEGGILRTRDGSTFMRDYHPLAELAPRDIVARAIHAERMKRGEPCVYLDVTHLNPDFLKGRFPTIYERLQDLGIDMARQPIPVVPAAHYQCGGVLADLNGCTGLAGLYAAGEVACTGVHGANRLASNSLLEALVFGRRSALHALGETVAASKESPPKSSLGRDPAPEDPVAPARRRLKETMNDFVGIVRNDRDLDHARNVVQEITARSAAAVKTSAPTADLHELWNSATVAEAIVECAMIRKESRGLHFTTDYPQTDDVRWRHDTVLPGRNNI